MTFTREQILRIVDEIPLGLLDPTSGSGSSESSRVMRRHDLIVWFTRRLDGWKPDVSPLKPDSKTCDVPEVSCQSQKIVIHPPR